MIPAKYLIFPVKLNVAGEVCTFSCLADLLVTLDDLNSTPEEKEDMIRARKQYVIDNMSSRALDCLKRRGIHDFSDFLRYTGNVIPMMRGFNGGDYVDLKSIDPSSYHFIWELRFPVTIKRDGEVLEVGSVTELSEIFCDCYVNDRSLSVLAQSDEVYTQDDKYYPSLRSFFQSLNIHNIDSFLKFSKYIVPKVFGSGVGPVGYRYLKCVHPDVKLVTDLKFPVEVQTSTGDTYTFESWWLLSQWLLQMYEEGSLTVTDYKEGNKK